MYKKILFGTCLTDYCMHVFNFTLNLAKSSNAKLWIYHGLGRLRLGPEETAAKIKAAEEQVAAAYVPKMKASGFSDFMINVSDGDVVPEMVKLARNARIDLLVMGTSTHTPVSVSEGAPANTLGLTATQLILSAPCPVLVIPPALIPGLATR